METDDDKVVGEGGEINGGLAPDAVAGEAGCFIGPGGLLPAGDGVGIAADGSDLVKGASAVGGYFDDAAIPGVHGAPADPISGIEFGVDPVGE